MSNPTWRNLLAAALAQARLRRLPSNELPRIALLGIGHELRGDDAVGVMIVRALQAKWSEEESRRMRWPLEIIDGGAAPENCTGALRRFRPDLVILIDAAQLNQEPGAVCWLDCPHLAGFSASTHTLPLDLLAHYLQAELGCQVALLGIQPADTAFDAPLSPAVQEAMSEILAAFYSGDLFANPM